MVTTRGQVRHVAVARHETATLTIPIRLALIVYAVVVLVLNVYSRNSLAILKALEDQVTLVGGAVRNVDGLSPGAVGWLKYPALSEVFRHADPLADFDGFCADVVRACAEYNVDAVMASGTTITGGVSIRMKS